MAKGDRVDDITFTISPGDTFNIFMDANRYKEMKRVADPSEHLLPTDEKGSVIPAFSLLEVTLASKNSDSALDKNSCVNILKVRRLPDDVTLHSVAPILSRLPSTLNDALLQSSEKAVKFPYISHDLVKDKVAFFRKNLNPCMMIESVGPGEATVDCVRITHWSLETTENINAIDIPSDVLLRACNARSLDHAVALLQIAVAMDDVSLFVTHNQFDARGGSSALRGFPLVDVSKITEKFEWVPMGFTEGFALSTDTGVDYFDGEGVGGQRIELMVDAVAKMTDVNSSEMCPPSMDLPLMMPGYGAAKMYRCAINLLANEDAEPPKEDVKDVLVFYLNAAKRSASAVVSFSGKRKLGS
ncbi:hypothetical protein T484DRAFT_1758636, partial [Baffinella frigidus]